SHDFLNPVLSDLVGQPERFRGALQRVCGLLPVNHATADHGGALYAALLERRCSIRPGLVAPLRGGDKFERRGKLAHSPPSSGKRLCRRAVSSAFLIALENSGRFRTAIAKPRVDGFMQPAWSVKYSRTSTRLCPSQCRRLTTIAIFFWRGDFQNFAISIGSASAAGAGLSTGPVWLISTVLILTC